MFFLEQHYEEKVLSALDSVCRSQSQTYEEFVNEFMYLKPGIHMSLCT
jgi:HSP90 family molecular chaperone